MNTTQLSNQLTSAGNSVAHQASSALDKAGDLSHRGAEAVRDGASQISDVVREGASQVREKAQNLSEQAVGYIQEKPVQSVLIAAATGATLMALLSLMARGARRG